MSRFFHRICTFIVVVSFSAICLAAFTYSVAHWMYPVRFNPQSLGSAVSAISAKELFGYSLLGLWAVAVVIYADLKSNSLAQKRRRKIKFREDDSSIHITHKAINDFLKQRLKAIDGVESTTTDFEQIKDGKIIVEIAANLRGIKPLPQLRKDIVDAAWDALENWLGVPTVQSINVVCEDIKYVNRELPDPAKLLPARREDTDSSLPAEKPKKKSWFANEDTVIESVAKTTSSGTAAADSGGDSIIDAQTTPSASGKPGTVTSYEVKFENEFPEESKATEGGTKFYTDNKKFYDK